MLSYQFVKAFFEYSKNRNVQLIVTTHESRLMDFDLFLNFQKFLSLVKKTGPASFAGPYVFA